MLQTTPIPKKVENFITEEFVVNAPNLLLLKHAGDQFKSRRITKEPVLKETINRLINCYLVVGSVIDLTCKQYNINS